MVSKPGRDTVILTILIVPYFIVGGFFLVATGIGPVIQATKWFDELFFQYNLVLALFMVLIIPIVTFVYVRTRKDEKLERLERELPDEDWKQNKSRIEKLVKSTFSFNNYLGSIFILMMVVTLGVFILLFLKPLPEACDNCTGLNYSKGANFLMLGPFIESYTTDFGKYYHRLIISLTAFQFGFLGAYIYFINHLIRSYFTTDLSPNTFVNSTVRMGTGSVMALVLSYVLPVLPGFSSDGENFLHFLPVISFFLGYFPSRAILFLERTVQSVLRMKKSGYASTPLNRLPGMSFENEILLIRHGFDNVENLSHGDALDLAVKTGFGYHQLNQWIGRGWLRAHLGTDAEEFEKASGITSREELSKFVKKWVDDNKKGRPEDYLAAAMPGVSSVKISVLCQEA